MDGQWEYGTVGSTGVCWRIYSTASLASQHAANQERQSRQQDSTRPSSKPKRKKTNKEGIQAGKRFPKVVVDEVDIDVSENECYPNDNALLSDLSKDDDSSISIDVPGPSPL